VFSEYQRILEEIDMAATGAAVAPAEELLIDGSVTVAGATEEFGIGRTKLYELMGNGALPYSESTGRRLIPRRAIRRLLAAGMIGVECGK
jgi:hypothetical protein